MTDSTTPHKTGMPYHTPALLDLTIEAMAIRPGGTYVDVTFGGGGHSRAILEAMGPVEDGGRLFCFDQDADAKANLNDTLASDPRVTFVEANFRYAQRFLRLHSALPVDGLLADLGVSFHQFDEADRGFTFREPEAPLDMRMDRLTGTTAQAWLATADEPTIAHTLRMYGELPNAKALAHSLIHARAQAPLTTTGQLAEAIRPLLNPKKQKQELAQAFQAIRIAVNDELGALEALLKEASSIVAPKGRIVFISYHSLEDRLVKHYLKAGNAEGELQTDFFGNALTPWESVAGLRKAFAPDSQEIDANPRARSAKLRVAERSPFIQEVEPAASASKPSKSSKSLKPKGAQS